MDEYNICIERFTNVLRNILEKYGDRLDLDDLPEPERLAGETSLASILKKERGGNTNEDEQ